MRNRRRTYMNRVLTAVITCVMILACMAPNAFAVDVTHEVISTGGESMAPFSTETGDDILFEVNIDLQNAAEKPDEIQIDLDTCFLFTGVNELTAYDESYNQLEWDGLENTSVTDGFVNIMLNPVPENAEHIVLTYTCTAGAVLNTGPVGMKNIAHVITHENNVRYNQSTSIDVESRRVYSWCMQLWTIDTNKDRKATTTSSGNTDLGLSSGIDMHPGQSVEGARFQIFTDENLTHPLSFSAGFRRYAVCPDANAKHVNEIQLDNAGRTVITGMKAGTYYIVETAPAYNYPKAIPTPIKIDFTYDEDELPAVKMMNNYNQETLDSTRIETRSGPTILIDYRYREPLKTHIPAMCIGAGFTVIVLFGLYKAYTALRKKTSNE